MKKKEKDRGEKKTTDEEKKKKGKLNAEEEKQKKIEKQIYKSGLCWYSSILNKRTGWMISPKLANVQGIY